MHMLLAMTGAKVMQSTIPLLPKTMFCCTNLRTLRSKAGAGKQVVGDSQAGLFSSRLTSLQPGQLHCCCGVYAVALMRWILHACTRYDTHIAYLA